MIVKISCKTFHYPFQMQIERIVFPSKSKVLRSAFASMSIQAIFPAYVGFLSNTVNNMKRGVLCILSIGLIKDFRWSKTLTTPVINLTTAICKGDPLIPPPLFTSTFSFSSKVFTISSYSLKIAKLKGVWLSLSYKFG